MHVIDYKDFERLCPENRPEASLSRNVAAFEQYSRQHLPGRVRQAFEAIIDDLVLPIEESLKSAIPQIVRTCQVQMFRDWERLSSGGGQGLEGDGFETLQTTDQEPQSEQQLLVPPISSQYLSDFHVGAVPGPTEDTLESPVHFDDCGEGPLGTGADSGYGSMWRNSDFPPREPLLRGHYGRADGATDVSFVRDDPEDQGLADLDFDFAEFVSEDVNDQLQ